jgi:hypothetical protein
MGLYTICQVKLQNGALRTALNAHTKSSLQAHQLHEELEEKRAMEYRLRAFTGDDFVLNSRYYKNNR